MHWLRYEYISIARICRTHELPDACDPAPYVARCSVLNDTIGIFATCISKLPPGAADHYYAECIMDACYSNGSSICKTVKMFNEMCNLYDCSSVSCYIWQTAVQCGNYKPLLSILKMC